MVAVSSKELLTYYLTTLQLGETVQSGLSKRSASTAFIESINHHRQRQQSQDHQVHELQQEPYQGKKLPEGEPRLPKSKWVVCIKEFQQAREDDVACARATPFIYRIPSYSKDAEKDAYIPRIMDHCLKSVKEVKERARACYSKRISMSSEDSMKMMVLDGCFVIELFLGVKERSFRALGYPCNDPVFCSSGGSLHMIQRDMIMLENQIPLFILDRLLGIQHGNPDKKGLVAKLAVRFFEPLMRMDEHSRTRLKYDPLFHEGGLHCLEVYRRSLLRLGPMPEARTWIKRGKTDRFWDIKFKCGTLQIPWLLIHSGTGSLFLNLIAFEQSQFDCSNAISSYISFMDNLINSPDDVGYLHYCGIIEHWLGSDAEVSDLFNRLCQEVAFNIDDSYLSELSFDLNRYYSLKWNNWRASLKHNYFSNPWTIISVIAAFVLLVITLTQTIYGVYGYYRPVS
ncbi:hypothetical protein BT93_L5119 [Corymbia citriodora subsp. variegata]|uniref:Uncharacterized protein n=1 Tax=Corymbia citriodora subsp. variegata TaxID=360336 RepID=A0A8T0CSS2_CORYI|nr:hypothetical protein BT93_L5119 [Corymbia citriodora subsp. variegata]